MLNFKALDSAYTDYQQTLIGNAHACSEEIKLITDKFIAMGINDVYHRWHETVEVKWNDQPTQQECDIGLLWDSSKQKIFYWFDCSEDKAVLAGEPATIRAAVRSQLQRLVNNAVDSLKKQKEELEPQQVSIMDLLAARKVMKALKASTAEKLKVYDTAATMSEAEKLEDAFDTASQMSEEDAEEAFWKEPEGGGPSQGDIMATNGIQD